MEVLYGFIWENHGNISGIYPLVMTNSSPWYRWPIEIDGLPSYNMVMFHGYVSHNQMVPSGKLDIYIYIYIYMQNHHVE